MALPAGTGQLAVEAADGLLAEQLRGTVFPAEGSVTDDVMRPHLGTLTVANRRGGALLRETEVQLVETFAEQAAVEELDRVIRDLRNYIFGLRPGILADRQLDQALQRLVEEFQERTGVVAIAQVDPQAAAELTGRAGEVVQLAREALSNVSRHAQAATCRVSLYLEGDGRVLEVDDDGRGFDPARVTGAGQGLRNLRERAEGLGGRAQIHSTPGQGTRVRVTIPR